VAEVPVITKTTGNNSTVYGSTGYAVNMTLSQLNFGSNWTRGNNTATADVVSLWNSSTKTFVSYYQGLNSRWLQAGNPIVDQSSIVDHALYSPEFIIRRVAGNSWTLPQAVLLHQESLLSSHGSRRG
jgi:hypothetical protein